MESLVAFLSLAVLGWAFWRIFREYFTKSPLDNIPGPPPTSFWKGNLPSLFDRHGWDYHLRNSRQYSQLFKFRGFAGTRCLYVYDPKALHNIIVKDQHIFEEPRWFLTWNRLCHGPGLVSTLGDQHKKQRRLLNPVFSINHMRYMTPLFYSATHRLKTAISMEIKSKIAGSDIDMLDWMSRLALELIGQGGLGYSFDPLVANTRNEFGEAIKRLLPVSFALHMWCTLYPYVENTGTPAFRRAVAKYLPSSDMQEMRNIIETLSSKCREIYNEKMAALAKGDEAVKQQISEGKDIMSILVHANQTATEADRLSEEEIIAQISILVFAGMDTTSNALARILQLLAQHPDAQDKMRAELMAARESEDIDYNQLVALPYLDAVCRETLRLYTPATFLFKETRQDAILPLSHPIRGVDGSELNEIFVPKDTSIAIGIKACNTSKVIWGEDADEWKPERWLTDLPSTVTEARIPGVYSNLMTFLGGSRSCIGFKFSQLEMKVVLAVLLRSFKFSLSNEEVVWNLSSINYPTVGPTSKKPSMPLKIETLEGARF